MQYTFVMCKNATFVGDAFNAMCVYDVNGKFNLLCEICRLLPIHGAPSCCSCMHNAWMD